MHLGKTVFAQLMDLIPGHEFRRCVDRYQGNYKVSTFSCWDQFLCMAFAQLTYRESLRDIETCLRALGPRLYHAGVRGHVSRSTLADANETRDFRIYADLAQVLMATARSLYADEDLGMELQQTVYALDSTTIDLCLSLFPWARYRAQNAAVKMHYILDRGYLDFKRLYRLQRALAFFVIRSRKDFRFRRLVSHPVDKNTGLRCDQTVRLQSFYPAKFYPEPLRRIRYHDAETEKSLVFLTNHFDLPTLTIAQLYKCRWQVELFFKWVKQHLRIKKFYGLSPNAVKTQIWVAISVYVVLAILRKQLRLDLSLYTISQILSLSLFEKMPLLQAFQQIGGTSELGQSCNQLDLFNL